MNRYFVTGALVLVMAGAAAMLAGCESDAQTGALIGTGVGVVAGQAIGHDTKSTLIGAGTGAAAGYMLGNEQDKQKMKAGIASAQEGANTITVNITNSNGSITPVILRRQGSMWVGPKGEIYTAVPTTEQLKPVYGF
jgi:uncharacterized protein YcfJ